MQICAFSAKLISRVCARARVIQIDTPFYDSLWSRPNKNRVNCARHSISVTASISLRATMQRERERNGGNIEIDFSPSLEINMCYRVACTFVLSARRRAFIFTLLE